MSKNYDNWERLVNAVVRRERDKQLALSHSRDPSSIGSPSSTTSNFSYISSNSEFDFDHEQYSLLHGQIGKEIPMDYSDLTLSHDQWKTMLPPDKHEVVFRSASLMFFLDQSTQKNCFLLGVDRLLSPEGEDPDLWEIWLAQSEMCLAQWEMNLAQWEMKSHPKSRFSTVAELLELSQFAIRTKIDAKMLDPETSYTPYLVFELIGNYKNLRVDIMIRLSNHDLIPEEQRRTVDLQLGNSRTDGWMEVETGNFYVRHTKNKEIRLAIQVTMWNDTIEDMNMKTRLIVEGIEFRPSRGIEFRPSRGIEFRPSRAKGLFSRVRFPKRVT